MGRSLGVVPSAEPRTRKRGGISPFLDKYNKERADKEAFKVLKPGLWTRERSYSSIIVENKQTILGIGN